MAVVDERDVATLGRLHLVTDARPHVDVLGVVRAALGAGAPVVQVRVDDHTSDREAYDLACRVVELCAAFGATCLVNDRLHVALAAGAAGGHVGADDLPVAAARQVLGPAAIVGATARDAATARAAQEAGASYLGVGPAYITSTKDGLPAPLGAGRIAEVTAAVDIPVIAIGGVTPERVSELLDSGVYGVAVVNAICGAQDPARATAAFVRAIERTLGGNA